MKKISLIALTTAAILSIQFAKAQDNDTSKNKIEVKKKVKTGVHGRQVTKVKVEGKGTPEALNKAAATATTEKTQVVTRPAPVVVVNQQPQATTTQAPKTVPTTQSTTITTSHTHVATGRSRVRRVHHKPGVTTTTTTTVKKE